VSASGVALTERGSTGHYYGNVPALGAGNYYVLFYEGSTVIGYGDLYWDGTKELLNKLDVDISTRSTQASVNSIPTNPLLTNDGRLNNIDATISSRASQSSVNAIPTNPLLTSDSRLSNLTTIELIRKLITNTSKIDELTNRLIVYDDDGTTPILQFNTKDSNGADSTTEIFEIRKI
jgi:hypothetical protein